MIKLKRVVDNQGQYYTVAAKPEGTEFCRVMAMIAKEQSSLMYDVFPTVRHKTYENGILGVVEKYTYDVALDEYRFYMNGISQGYSGDNDYFLYISMRLFNVSSVVVSGDGAYVVCDSEELYQLMRNAENNGAFDAIDSDFNTCIASVWVAGDNGMPEIEYYCDWEGFTSQEIPSNQFYRLFHTSKGIRTNWQGLKYTTGIKTMVRNGKYGIVPNIGMAMIAESSNSKFSPNCIEMFFSYDGGSEYVVRLYFELSGLNLTSLQKYDTNAMQTWCATDGDYYTLLSDNYTSTYPAYYDGEDFNPLAASNYRTPEKLYIFRMVNKIWESIYFDSGLTGIVLARTLLRDFQTTGNSLEKKVIGDGADKAVAVTVSGSDVTIVDYSVNTYLKAAIDDNVFGVGDVFIDDDGDIAIIDSIDVDHSEISATKPDGGSMDTNAKVEEWEIVHEFDQIMKMSSYAYSTKEASLSISAQRDFLSAYRHYAGYYGRNIQMNESSGQRMKMIAGVMAINKVLYVPGNKLEDILEDYDEVSSNLGVKINPIGMSTKFVFKDVVGYLEQQTIEEKDGVDWFLLQKVRTYPYIDRIEIYSHYVEEKSMLDETPGDARKLWVKSTDGDYALYHSVIQDAFDADLDADELETVTLADGSSIPVHATNELLFYAAGELIVAVHGSEGNLSIVSRSGLVRKHFDGDEIYYLANLFNKQTQIGSINTELTDVATTIVIDEIGSGFDNMTVGGSRDKTLVVGSGIGDECEIVYLNEGNITEDPVGVFSITSIVRGNRGTSAKDFGVGTPVYLMDYMSVNEALRVDNINVEYQGDYRSEINLKSLGTEELDQSNTERIYVVRVKWKL